MNPSTVMKGPGKPSAVWILVVLVAGALGSLAAIAAAGKGTYDVGAFKVELRATPALLGKTEIACRHSACPVQGHAEAGTHRAPIVLRMTIVGVNEDQVVPSDLARLRSPKGLADFYGDEAKDAAISFGIKLALLAAAGGAAGGAAISFGRLRRIPGGLIAGVLTVAVIGLLLQQTYDRTEFAKTRFVTEKPALPLP